MLNLTFVSIALLIVAGLLFVRELLAFSQTENRLPVNSIVGGVDVGGMTPEEAQAAWVQTYAQPVILYYEDSPIVLDPASVGFRVNWQTMLAEATSTGESAGSFWIRFFNHLTQQELQEAALLPLDADYQRSLLQQYLQDVARRYDAPPGDAGYDLQTLTTFAGEGGVVLDMDAAVTAVEAALRDPINRTVNLPLGGRDAGRPGIETLRDLIIAYLDSQNFIYDGQSTVASVYVLDLATGEEINMLGDVAFSAASTMKVPILIDYFRFLTREPSQDEAWLMANSLLCSRNSSSNLLMTLIGSQDIFSGISQVTQTAQYLGARNTYIAAPFVEGVANQQLGAIAAPDTAPNASYNTGADPYNQTTAEDMGTLFSLIYDCASYGSGLMTALPDQFTQQECRQMLELMSANDLYRLLQGGIPEGERISHKNGWLTDMVGDAGIVFSPNGRDYVISVFLWEETETNFQDFERLWPLVEGISRATWNYFNPEESLISPRTLPPTALDCEGNYLPPNAAAVNLNDINAWRR
ncbi:MAG: hypothetical protein OHK0046_07020 [Anaerolineae bacterium]